MADNRLLFISTEPAFDTIAYPYPNPPQKVIIREVDIDLIRGPSGRYFFEFSYSQYCNIRSIADQTEFVALLQDLQDPGFVFDGGPSVLAQPFSTKLSLGSHNELAYIVFKLSPDSWRFSTSPPIKVGRAAFDAEAYYDATLVADNLAYFISDGPKAYAKGTYPHPFNLYVEFDQSRGNPIELVVDPDVRHPGGSLE